MLFIIVANIILSETRLHFYCKKQMEEKKIKKYKSIFLLIYYPPVCNSVSSFNEDTSPFYKDFEGYFQLFKEVQLAC